MQKSRIPVILSAALVLMVMLTPSAEANDDARDHTISSNCSVTLNGAERTYQSCASGIGGKRKLSVYWSVANDGKSVDTMLVGTPRKAGYISWAWGASRMVGATAAIANSDEEGNPAVAAYALNGKRSSQVVKADGFFSESNVELTDDGELRARFVQKLDQTGDVSALWAYGGPVSSSTGQLQHHDARGALTLELSTSSGSSEDGPASESPAPCVAVAHLQHLSTANLVFASHRMASVLCDESGSCATRAHIVTFRGKPMTMRAYCGAFATCVQHRMLVNSPRMARALRIASNTTNLLFTALSARYETWVEETVLRALVRIGV